MANNPYPIVVAMLSPEDGEGYLGFAPDLQGCMSDGATPEEALKNCQQAVLEWIDAATEAGQPVPLPNSAHANAVRARDSLIQKIKEQTETLEQLDKEIGGLRTALKALTQRIQENKPTWHIDPMPTGATLRALKETAIH